MRVSTVTTALLGLCALAACGKPVETEEINKRLGEILAKLDGLEKSIQQVRAAPAAPARPTLDPNKVYDIPVGNSHVKGPKDAKVTIVEFSDFQCPFCSQAAALVKQVLDSYPKDVNFVYKQFPLTSIHPNALPAAKASLAAGKQGKFWEMHDLLFQNPRELGVEKFKEYAKQLKLDVARFEKDFNSPEIQQQVDQEMREARAADVSGTPTFFVAGKRLQVRTVEGFKQMIDDALKKG